MCVNTIDSDAPAPKPISKQFLCSGQPEIYLTPDCCCMIPGWMKPSTCWNWLTGARAAVACCLLGQ